MTTKAHILRDTLQETFNGQPMFCGECGILSVVGKGLNIVVHTYSPAPMTGGNVSFWAICQDIDACKQRQSANKKKK